MQYSGDLTINYATELVKDALVCESFQPLSGESVKFLEEWNKNRLIVY